MKDINKRQWQVILALKLGMKREGWVSMKLLNSFLKKPVAQSTVQHIYSNLGYAEKTQFPREIDTWWGSQVKQINHYRLSKTGNEVLIKKLHENSKEN